MLGGSLGRSWRWRVALAALSALTLGALVLGAARSAGAAGRLQRIGPAPVLPRGTLASGQLPASRPLHVTITLRPRSPAALSAYAEAVSTPGAPDYRHYLTPSQFAVRFGAAPSEIATVQRTLRAEGLQPGPVAANRLSIPLSADAGTLERAFSLSLLRVRLPDGRSAVVNDRAPALPALAAGQVQAVVGLSSLQAPRPLRQPSAPRMRAAPVGRLSGHVATGGPQPCGAAGSGASSQGAYTADQIASAYSFSGLYRAGDEGQGETVALYELEPYAAGDIAAYASCYGIDPQISNVTVDGGAGSGPGSGEAALDIEQVIGLAPRARVLVYEGPNSNSDGPGSGPYDVLSAIVTQDAARIVSTSWGQCEALQGAAAVRAESVLLEEAAIQGQSVLAAAGDEGSEDCNEANNTPNTSLAVDDPGSQPWVTSVGGTTLSALGPPPREVVWNNGGNVGALLGLAPGAGGGGLSRFWAMPAYQSAAAAALHVIGRYSSGGPCSSAGDCREVPDVAADADPNTGYEIYYNGSGAAGPGVPSGWQASGGTSAAAPLWAALVALADAGVACSHGPVGFLNPALYRAAGSAYAADFHDITSGNNDFTATNGGRYPAGTGYDMASGLGTPDAAALAGTLCAGALEPRSPGSQLSTVGASVRVVLRSSDAAGERPFYSAISLPPGLRVNRTSGVISGRARRTGTYTARILVYDGTGDGRELSFPWRVLPAPRLTGLSLDGVARGRPVLALRIQTARGAPALRFLALRLPSGLRLRAGRGLTVRGAGGRRLRYRSQVARGVLRVALARASALLSLRIAAPALAVEPGLRSRQRAHRPVRLRLILFSTDTRRGVTVFSRSLRPRG
jgi:subtilase family serine protease